MVSRLPEIDKDGEVGDLSKVDPALFKPFSELPESLKIKLSGRGKQKSPTKVSTTVRFDADVLEAFKATGSGWQTRMNEALKEWLREHRET
ncbi:MAG: BrnA antitoxin family protein [Nitrosomonas sp.]|nr:BrnA antitoxin family protein [Nitrosomonas sp.]MBP9100536.1 BrnA antitoxin family protein [Nitrosomonas sp.]